MGSPTISVIVPNYNHARFLRRRLDSILEQTFQDFELILLDDCSTDESRLILSAYASHPRVRLEFNEANSGSTFKQWNKGVRMARGDYVWMAESDDYADSHFLERLVSILNDDPDVAFAYCRSWLVSEAGMLTGFGDYYLADLGAAQWTSDFSMDGVSMCRKYFYAKNAVPNASSVVFRRAVYQHVGEADEALRLVGDWKLWAAMALIGKVSYVAEPLNYFRFHSCSVRERYKPGLINVAENLEISRWVLDRVECREQELEKLCDAGVKMWLPAVLSFRTPLTLKWRIARDAWALDPHAMRRAIRPALTAVRLKIRRHWRGTSPRGVPGRNEKPLRG